MHTYIHTYIHTGRLVSLVCLIALQGLLGFSFPFYPFYLNNKQYRNQDESPQLGAPGPESSE